MTTEDPGEMSEDASRPEQEHLEWSSIIGVTRSIRRVDKRAAGRQTYLNQLETIQVPKERAILQVRIALGSRLIESAERDRAIWNRMWVSAAAGSSEAFEKWRSQLTSEGQQAYSGYRTRLAANFDGMVQRTNALTQKTAEAQTREADRKWRAFTASTVG